MSRHDPEYSILQKVSVYAGTKTLPPLSQQPKQAAVHRNDEHVLWPLITMSDAKDNPLNHQSCCSASGQGRKLCLQIAAEDDFFANPCR